MFHFSRRNCTIEKNNNKCTQHCGIADSFQYTIMFIYLFSHFNCFQFRSLLIKDVDLGYIRQFTELIEYIFILPMLLN